MAVSPAPFDLRQAVKSLAGALAAVNVLWYALSLGGFASVNNCYSGSFAGLLHPLCEQSLLALLINTPLLLTMCVAAERALCGRPAAIYLAFVTLAATVLAWVVSAVILPCDLDGDRCGPWAAVAALLVAQCYTRGLGAVMWPIPSPPDPTTAGDGAASAAPPTYAAWRRWAATVRARHLPLLYVVVAVAVDILVTAGLLYRSLLAVCGAVVGWAYLDFSWRDAPSVTTFALSELLSLPPMPKALVTAYNRVARRVHRGGGAGGGESLPTRAAAAPDGSGRVLLPGSTPAEAERRRAIALAALSRRLQEQNATAAAAPAAPDAPPPAAAAAAEEAAPTSAEV